MRDLEDKLADREAAGKTSQVLVVNYREESMLKHAGGIDDDLGGVDPEIDEVLVRLAGGP